MISRTWRPPHHPLWAIAAFALGISGCYTSDAGREPPPDLFDFPTGLAVSPGRSVLYVANSDFDLQYNGGTVLAMDLDALRASRLLPMIALLGSEAAGTACADPTIGLARNDNRILNPGPCTAIAAQPFIKNHATIGAFASGVLLVARGDAPGARLFVPVRGDPSVTYLDIDDDRDPANKVSPCTDLRGFCLQCDQTGSERRCSSTHRTGENPYDNLRRLTLPVEPIGIAAAEVEAGGGKATALVTAHQTLNAASLLENPWTASTGLDRPTLQFVLGALPDGPTEVASVPVPGLVAADSTVSYQPGFVLSYRQTAEVDLLRYSNDDASKPRRPFITKVGGTGVTTNASGQDSRGIVVDGSERRACEATCAVAIDPAGCLQDCLAVPLRLFIANRAPASLLVGEITTTVAQTGPSATGLFDIIRLYDSIPLSAGASHVALGTVIDRQGRPALRVFAVAFDSRFVFAYDPINRRVDTIIRTGRGPHPIAFDTCVPDGVDAAGLGTATCRGEDKRSDGKEGHSFLFVGHFTDSYVGVVDLDMRDQATYGTMFATVGQPTPPPESK